MVGVPGLGGVVTTAGGVGEGGGRGVGGGGGGGGDGGGQGENLRRAAAQGDTATVLRLLEEGVNVNCVDECGYSPLQRAACEGYVHTAHILLKHHAAVDHQDDQHGNTALHEAAWKGYSQTAEVLLRNKANVYIKNKGGFAPLHLTCQNGHNQTCRVLLLAGCKPDLKNNYGDTPLHTAARYGHAGVTRILLSARATVHEMNKNGDTALHIAAAMGRRKLTKILLEAAADQSIRNKQQETPEDIAKRKDFVQILEILRNPPPIVTPEERLQQEQEQKKRETKEVKAKTKNDKKREKTNDSGTSSKDSSTQHKEKKKHKSEHKEGKRRGVAHGDVKPVDWSPYGCHYYPPTSEFPIPDLDSLPKEPLSTGEQYFIDLAGNIKKGPVGVGYTCYCAPFFKNVEHKLEADKVALMDHIDAAHDKLDAKMTRLEHKTKSHIQHLSDTVNVKLAQERDECQQRMDRLRNCRDRQTEARSAALQTWVERKLANSRDQLDGDHRPSSRTYTCRGYGRRTRNPLVGVFPLTRSRSEEALSEYRDQNVPLTEEPLYKGLRVLDHPTSMYNIPQRLCEEDGSVMYDLSSHSPAHKNLPESRSHSLDGSHGSRREDVSKGPLSHSVEIKKIQKPEMTGGAAIRGKEILNRSTSSSNIGEQNSATEYKSSSDSSPHKSASPLVVVPNSPLLTRLRDRLKVSSKDSTLETSSVSQRPKDKPPISSRQNETVALPTTNDLPRAVHNLRVSSVYYCSSGVKSKTQSPHQEMLHNNTGSVAQSAVYGGWAGDRTGYSRYDYRTSNPYMYSNMKTGGYESEVHGAKEEGAQRSTAKMEPSVSCHPSQVSTSDDPQQQYLANPKPRIQQNPHSAQGNSLLHHPGEAATCKQNCGSNGSGGHQSDTYAQPIHTQTIHAQIVHAQTVHAQPVHRQPIHAPVHTHSVNAQEDHDGSTYLDMDRYRIQQAVRRLYDGYLTDGRTDLRRQHLETSIEHDPHNDSGYSTRLCTASQGPSPALSGMHEGSDNEAKTSAHLTSNSKGPPGPPGYHQRLTGNTTTHLNSSAVEGQNHVTAVTRHSTGLPPRSGHPLPQYQHQQQQHLQQQQQQQQQLNPQHQQQQHTLDTITIGESSLV